MNRKGGREEGTIDLVMVEIHGEKERKRREVLVVHRRVVEKRLALIKSSRA